MKVLILLFLSFLVFSDNRFEYTIDVHSADGTRKLKVGEPFEIVIHGISYVSDLNLKEIQWKASGIGSGCAELDFVLPKGKMLQLAKIKMQTEYAGKYYFDIHLGEYEVEGFFSVFEK